MAEKIVQKDDDSFPIALSDTQFEITDTNLVDGHLPQKQLHKELERGATDMGEGFLMRDEPVVVDRDRNGAIVRVTPVSEHSHFLPREEDPFVAETKQTPVKLPREERTKLVEVLATRLFRHYEGLDPNAPVFNPLYDGIPDLPSGSAEHLQPLPGTQLYPATRGQVYE